LIQRPTIVWSADLERWRRDAQRMLALLLAMQEPIEATLAANAASTTIMARLIGPSSAVVPVPLTAHAAAELYGGTMYPSAQAAGSITFAHANNAETDRDFRLCIIG
jgi:hypothetical protein